MTIKRRCWRSDDRHLNTFSRLRSDEFSISRALFSRGIFFNLLKYFLPHIKLCCLSQFHSRCQRCERVASPLTSNKLHFYFTWTINLICGWKMATSEGSLVPNVIPLAETSKKVRSDDYVIKAHYVTAWKFVDLINNSEHREPSVTASTNWLHRGSFHADLAQSIATMKAVNWPLKVRPLKVGKVLWKWEKSIHKKTKYFAWCQIDCDINKCLGRQQRLLIRSHRR